MFNIIDLYYFLTLKKNAKLKKQLIIYGILIIAFILYNFLEPVKDQKADTLINILFASALFLYIAYIAYLVLKKMGKKDK